MGQAKYCEPCTTAMYERHIYKSKAKKYWTKAMNNSNGYGPRAEIAFEVIKDLTN